MDLSLTQLEEMNRLLALREREVFPHAVRAIDGERVLFGGAVFEMLRDKYTPLMDVFRQAAGLGDEGDSAPERAFWLEVFAFLYTRPMRYLLNQDQLAWLDFHLRFRENLKNPLNEDGVYLLGNNAELVENIPKTAILTRLSAPAFGGIPVLCMVQLERFRLGQLAIASTIFAREQGRWPVDLNELAAAAPDAPLRDQFSGKNYEMHPEENSLELKSGAYDWEDERISNRRRQGLVWSLRGAN